MNRRRFNKSERIAMYLASDGKCTVCGIELEPQWHGDHINPYSNNGETDVINGQALCPPCNFKKGNTMTQPLRAWQIEAKTKFDAMGRPSDFLVSATPGAGKTTFAVSLSCDLIERGLIDRVVVIVNTDSLRTQWADKATVLGLHLKTVNSPEDYQHAGYDGAVMTYAQIAESGRLLARRAIGQFKTLVIMDEIHHAGDNRSWGSALMEAAEPATFRIALTGTPWRSDSKSPIPFVRYGSDGKVVVDYAYEYGAAVADEVCRRVAIESYDCETVRWVDFGKVSEASLGDELDDEDVSAVMETIYAPSNQWISVLLSEADKSLSRIRQDGAPDAGGVVIASTQEHAKAYGHILRMITGEDPVVVISEDGKAAKDAITAFDNSTNRWIVSVNMISEGVDIPRLAVGVYASRTQTPLFFRQVIGRIVRRREGEEFNATLFIPALPKLKEFARDIEKELRHQLDTEIEGQKKEQAQADRDQRQFSFREPLSASDAVFDATITAGVEFTQSDIDAATQECRRVGIPEIYVANVARMRMRERDVTVTVTPQPNPVPRHRAEKLLRKEIQALANKVDNRLGEEPGWANCQVLKAGYPKRGEATMEDLEQILGYLAGLA